MAQFVNYYEPIQIFMDSVKKDILSKTNNLYNIRNSREIINPLFNLFDYQITLINQIVLFIQNVGHNDNIDNNGNNNNNINYLKTCSDYNNKKSSQQKNNINYLIDINKDILVSMIIKFLSKINSLINKNNNYNNYNKYNNKSKYNLKSESTSSLSQGKGMNLYQDYNKNNLNKNLYPYDNKYNNIRYILKKNMNKNNNKNNNSIHKNSSMRNLKHNINSNSSIKYNNKTNDFNYFNQNKNNDIYGKHKKFRNELDNNSLITNSKIGDKGKDRTLQTKSYSNSTKDIFIDLNDDALKTLFNRPIYLNSTHTLNTKASKED